MPDHAAPDIHAAVEAARADLAAVTRAIRVLWAELYAPDARAEVGRITPQPHSRPAWEAPATIQQTYIDVVAELSRAHWVLGRHTPVPVHWTHPPDTSERARTVPHSEALAWTQVLDGMLAWIARQASHNRDVSLDDGSQEGHPTPGTQRGSQPEWCAAVEQACDHVHAARRRAADLLEPPPRTLRRCRRRGCEGEDGKPRTLVEGDGKVCRACRKRDSRVRQAS